eukprot:5957976-Prorocentrum_lima.AAC.1
MTSSLVGSEMCIRDRLNSQPGADGVVALVQPARTGAGPRVNAMVTQCAVSYTHLTLPTICSV